MVIKDQAEGILAGLKIIAANFVWRFDRRGYRPEAPVLAEDTRELLKLRRYAGRIVRSFALLYRNTPIGKYTVHRLHIDPGGVGGVVTDPWSSGGFQSDIRRRGRILHNSGRGHLRFGLRRCWLQRATRVQVSRQLRS